MGLKPPEPDDSEFVEVDPTGRYGRVWTKILFFYTGLLCAGVLVVWVDFFFLSYLMQYNEILGKGASKTVYEILLQIAHLPFPSLIWVF